ncbi:hypothetical protein [Nocardioides hwasunensis]|uniref:Glycosyltransferase RgtA/B/C/D-like domain-containing protein n=1 Tax=Nocardioides hwasunensis TaxID=397258 RepID=A0ABR8ML40_9ACTN|nr:hypothetical protein [Nocardioides hwasunensis]MBD3914779.1 hypothetical protein [Nocardioides hwasunensis]
MTATPVRTLHLAGRQVEWTVALGAVALRVPFLAAPAHPDEAGYLQVAAQWSTGGGSLYGHYWVDRPPLLITLFQVAAAAGGLVPLRLIGCLAVATTVLLCARSGELIGGPRASRWTAAATAVLLVAPRLGTQEVNGELLAAPFVAAGVLALVTASCRPSSAWLPFLGGVCGTCAVLVKQNHGDVAVFFVALVVATRWSGRDGHLRRLVAACAAGSLATLLAACVWVLAHGTSPAGVLDAMYAFRVESAHLLVEGDDLVTTRAREMSLVLDWLLSGLGLLTVAVVLSVRRWVRRPVLLALDATIVFDLVSVVLGGGFWNHYLIELVVPLGIAGGVLAADGSTVAVAAVLATLVLSLVPAARAIDDVPRTSVGEVIGTGVRDASRPGDTLVTLYGQPEVNLAAGLPSPYPYLWTLPARTLDPGLSGLDAVLDGRQAPTWLVLLHGTGTWGLDTSHIAHLVRQRYHPVAEYRGHTVCLRDGLSRPLIASGELRLVPPFG